MHLTILASRATLALARNAVFSLCLALTCSSLAWCQDPSGIEATSAAPIGLVYLQVAKGVNVYSESAAGKLTLVKGSPFGITGQMEGITGEHLLSVGTTKLHSYEVAPNGAIGAQVASIDTAAYDSEDCGPTTGNKAILDHSGKYFYVQLGSDDQSVCENSDLQTYQIGSNGLFTFMGNFYTDGTGPYPAPVFDSSDKYAYSFDYDLSDESHFVSFIHMNDPVSNPTFTETDPAIDPSLPYVLESYLTAADPHEHLAVLMAQCPLGDDVCEAPYQLASYTINTATGGISSSNTEDNIPYVELAEPFGMDMSYDGKFVAVSGTTGFQVFNFNGAAVPTKLYSLKLSGIQIDQVTWDKAGHLFALSYEKAKLYIFNVSKKDGVVEIGSPLSVPGAYGSTGILVVPK